MNRLTKSPDGLGLLDGTIPFTWRGTLTWTLYGLWLHSQAEARNVVRDRRSVGANTVCFASQLCWLHQGRPYSIFAPTITPGYHNQIRSFADMLQEEEMRACMVVLCDTAYLGQDYNAMRDHWKWCYTAVGDQPNWTLVVANQPFHPTQSNELKDHIMEFERPPSIAGFPPLLVARDNPNEDNPPTTPPLDFAAFCSKRNEPFWYVEAGGLSMWTIVNDHTNCPTVLFEPPPCGRRSEWTDPGKWRQFGRSLCFKGTVGANFYSDHDAASLILTGPTRDCAVEFLGNIPLP